MNTKLLMSACAFFLGLLGLVTTFMPQEILNYFGISASGVATIIIQVIGALYIGFGFLNWMAKGSKIGGIYARPIIMGNMTHFTIAALALFKAGSSGIFSPMLWVLTIFYTIFAVLFCLLGLTDLIPSSDK